jgi:hypothetical protein
MLFNKMGQELLNNRTPTHNNNNTPFPSFKLQASRPLRLLRLE